MTSPVHHERRRGVMRYTAPMLRRRCPRLILTHITLGRAVLCACIVLWQSGCGAGPRNRSFALTAEQAGAAIRAMEDQPRAFERPVIALAGWADPFFMEMHWRETLGEAGGDTPFATLSFFGQFTFEQCRDSVIALVEERWPSDDPHWTTEVDVVGYSMGGLIARYAALPPMNPQESRYPDKRLKIHRLFTISTPHTGAQMANLLPPLPHDRRLADMSSGSKFLAYLNAGLTEARYRLYPYVRLGDVMVGPTNAAPPGKVAWWVPNAFLQWPHADARSDMRITADILRRLRGEPHYAHHPRQPLPQ